MEEGNVSEIELERRDTHLRRDLIVGVAQEHFRTNALVENKPWTPEDAQQVKNFLLSAAPFAHPKVNPSYWEHLVIASLYARKIAEKAPSLGLDPNEAEALELLHDVGRLAIAHRYLRNDIVEHSMFIKAGVRRELLEKLPSVPGIIGVKVPFISSAVYHSFEDVSTAQRAFDVADNFGKRDRQGELLDIRTFMEYEQQSTARYTGGMWASERAGRKAYTRNIEKQQFANELLLKEVGWLEEKHGIYFGQLREEVAHELQKPEHREFLLDLKDTQETLDPNTDRLLERPTITILVFDIGSVLCGGQNGEDVDLLLAQKLAQHFDCTADEAYTALLESLADGKAFSGKISEEEYLAQFWQRLDKTPPMTIDELRTPFMHPEIYSPIEGMQDVVAQLSKKPNIKIFCLSDQIITVTLPVLQSMKKYFPQIKQENILVSNRIEAAKKEPGAPAFVKLLEALGQETDPESVLFIDDKEGYTTIARVNYNIRGFTFRGNPFKGLTASGRLKRELQKAELL